ncbi:hypothetical protein JB92DRAFT_3042719 [Gautieria morchelliformis]|nr:hypothetical protein JB92DRAFT_3042719 [Gautieria morchelliformis]
MFRPMNAFSSLVIDGLVKIDSVDVSLTCFKGISKPTKPITTLIEYFARAGGLPARLPSKLPTPGNLCLHVSVTQDRLGRGRVGSVYPVRLDETEQNSLPPLVMKVATRHRSDNLAREAWFYEEMENIQGSSIARCYGFFTAEIDSNSEVLDWAESDVKHNPDEEDDPLDEEDDPSDEDGDSPGSNDEGITKEDTVIISNHTVPPPASDGNGRTFISVLVLERLGDMMPVLVSLTDIEPDIHEIYSDLGQFGVEQMDVRWRNILAAPTPQYSLVCPYHGHKHHWRVVDFDRSRKSNFTLDHIERAQGSWIRTLLSGLTIGHVVEPWD